MKENVNESNQDQPYQNRLYNSFGLWIFLYLTIISVGFYIIAVDFSFSPHQQMKPQSKNLRKSITNQTNEPLKINKQNSINRSKALVAID